MARLLGGMEAGLSGPLVTAARPARDISPEAHRYAFATWYASVPEPAPVAGRLYEQVRSPDHWVPYAPTPGRCSTG
ncbi:hypothetical protein ACH4M0_21725 [Streptomyces albidoflavus]|uniref:hypothetical protein n=1 Tax=unclassified Streptomyces TaxID=2593676 RepID=UPI001A4E73B2|nr:MULTISPECIES: hypothetical protein [unclassified Streptomyces]MBL0801031.1 hypothetical protein [Streptomyces albidoflavus]MCG5118811.1 hypothetical protein [Streptomyces sp. T7(2022)]MCK2143618.1 hypothetical protein [Streptomyces sp. WAC00276]MCQ9705904.1 hypothetical protein [Streptomyces sp. BSP1]